MDLPCAKPVDRKCLGQLGIYQPEDDGYQVTTFSRGTYDVAIAEFFYQV